MSNLSFWDYFIKLPSDNNVRKAMCKLCNETYNFTTTSYNLKTHLNRKHSDEFTALITPKRRKCIATYKNKIWNYFTKVKGEKRAKCNICHKEFSYRSTVANLNCHLQFKHPEAHETVLQNKSSATQHLSIETQSGDSANGKYRF